MSRSPPPRDGRTWEKGADKAIPGVQHALQGLWCRPRSRRLHGPLTHAASFHGHPNSPLISEGGKPTRQQTGSAGPGAAARRQVGPAGPGARASEALAGCAPRLPPTPPPPRRPGVRRTGAASCVRRHVVPPRRPLVSVVGQQAGVTRQAPGGRIPVWRSLNDPPTPILCLQHKHRTDAEEVGRSHRPCPGTRFHNGTRADGRPAAARCRRDPACTHAGSACWEGRLPADRWRPEGLRDRSQRGPRHAAPSEQRPFRAQRRSHGSYSHTCSGGTGRGQLSVPASSEAARRGRATTVCLGRRPPPRRGLVTGPAARSVSSTTRTTKAPRAT